MSITVLALGYLVSQAGFFYGYHKLISRKKPRKFKVKFVKEHPDAKLPAQKQGDAAFDLCSVEAGTIGSGETVQIDTGLRLADMPLADEHGSGLYFQVLGRSGKALSGVYPIGGVLDGIYRGTLKVIMHNGSNSSWSYDAGDKVAQMALVKIEHNSPTTEVVFSWTDKVVETTRGATGFGSSGK